MSDRKIKLVAVQDVEAPGLFIITNEEGKEKFIVVNNKKTNTRIHRIKAQLQLKAMFDSVIEIEWEFK